MHFALLSYPRKVKARQLKVAFPIKSEISMMSSELE